MFWKTFTDWFRRQPDADQLATDIAKATEALNGRLADVYDAGWIRAGAGPLSSPEYAETSLQWVKSIAAKARAFYIENPLIQRAVSVQSDYVWASGAAIKARDKKVAQVIEDFMESRGNRRVLFARQPQTMFDRMLCVDGNIFILAFSDVSTGATELSYFPLSECEGAILNPNNRAEVWFYKRRVGNEVVLHPALDYRPASMPSRYKDLRVAAGRVLHVKVGGLPDMVWGIPEPHSSLAWVRAYTQWLEDWATITRSLTRFAWKAKGVKKAGEVSALQQLFGSTLTAVSGGESNYPPEAGSILTVPEGRDMEPVKTSGAIPRASDGRLLRLMAVAGVGWPDSFFGDMDQSSLATAKSLDRPTELKVVSRQELWADVYRDLFHYVLMESTIAPNGIIKGRVIRSRLNPNELRLEARGSKSLHVEVKFPPVVVEKLVEQVQAIVSAATLDGKMPADTMTMHTLSRLLNTALGNRDIDAELEELQTLWDDQVRQEKRAIHGGMLNGSGKVEQFQPAQREQQREEQIPSEDQSQ